ncbi:hypothetical protein PVAP13_7KG037858 [Panicum virgatum]|uniref:Uncharacterized protein n=1 Tax=Panicum virgatum TaxID=38727 RepID=A0A8T0QAG2_PANVG|nr:hypothetical protein PVAP13_7KG037858 [Panicum virgatum]
MTKIDKIKYFHFLHSQGGRFNTERTTGQVLCVELWLPNGFTPSVLIENRMFLQSSSNQGKWASMLPHCAASALCLSLPSLREMMGKYHATLIGPPLLPFLPLVSMGSFPSSTLLSPSSFVLLK